MSRVGRNSCVTCVELRRKVSTFSVCPVPRTRLTVLIFPRSCTRILLSSRHVATEDGPRSTPRASTRFRRLCRQPRLLGSRQSDPTWIARERTYPTALHFRDRRELVECQVWSRSGSGGRVEGDLLRQEAGGRCGWRREYASCGWIAGRSKGWNRHFRQERAVLQPEGESCSPCFLLSPYDTHIRIEQAGLEQAQMLVVSDIDDMFVPLREGFLVDPIESRHVTASKVPPRAQT